METFECGSQEHYQEYLKGREHFPDETVLTYEEFIESVTAD